MAELRSVRARRVKLIPLAQALETRRRADFQELASEVSAQLSDSRTWITGSQAGKALSDPSDRSLVAEHLQRDLQPFQIVCFAESE